MSQPVKRGGGRGGGAAGGRKPLPSTVAAAGVDDFATTSDRATPASKADSDPKDDSSSNGDKREVDVFTPKPPSAGASIRETANKVLALAMKSEWTPIEAELKKLEKYVANAGEDGNHIPLAGVHDLVISLWTYLKYCV